MRADTRLFGEIDIEEDKIITLESGMIGLPDYRKFALIFDEEAGMEKASVMWFQSMDDPKTAFPVMQPNVVKPDYNPTVNDEMLAALGQMTEENIYVLVTMTAAPDVKNTSVNLKAPIVINTDTRKGCQIIVEDDYPVKFKIYEALEDRKKEGGGIEYAGTDTKKGESLVINNNIEITVLEIRGDQVKIGISAPKEVPVYRKEVYLQIQDENKASLNVDAIDALKNLF